MSRRTLGVSCRLDQTRRNRALLARQLLLERVRLPLPRAVERMGGIKAQYAPSAYIALWSRVEGFQREQVTRALERRMLVQASPLRGTIHVVSRRDLWPWLEAIRKPTLAWFKRVRRDIDLSDARRAGQKIRAALRAGPLTPAELLAAVGRDGWLAGTLYVKACTPFLCRTATTPTSRRTGAKIAVTICQIGGWHVRHKDPTGGWSSRRSAAVADCWKGDVASTASISLRTRS